MSVKSYIIGVVMLTIVQYCRFSACSPLDHSVSTCSFIEQPKCMSLGMENISEVQKCPRILVKVEKGLGVLIESFPEETYEAIETEDFKQYQLPLSGCSIQAILDRLRIKRVRILSLTSYNGSWGKTLVRQHLYGLSNLEQLNISGNLTDLPVDLLNDLGNLYRLELGMNHLTYLKEGIFGLQKQLKYLTLNKNDLQNLTKDVFIGLPLLTTLDLSSNKLVNLDAAVFSLLKNLKVIDLSANPFISLPVGLFNANKKLQKCVLLMDQRYRMEILPAGLLANLTELNIVNIGCGLTNISTDLFQGSRNIKIFSLTNNYLDVLPVELFANMQKVYTIDLQNNQLKELDDKLFEKTISLEYLVLSHNLLEQISDQLFIRLKNINKIDISNNRLHTIYKNAFSDNGELMHLMLQNNNLSFINAALPLEHLTQLCTLNLRNNSMTSIITTKMIRNKMCTVKELDISYNKLATISLSDPLFQSRGTVFNLTYNAIQKINFSDFDNLKPNQNVIYLAKNPLWCDCDLLHFIQVLRNQNITTVNILQIILGDLKCSGPDRLAGRLAIDIEPEELLCLLDDTPDSAIPPCPQNCSCFNRPFDKGLIVNCSNANLDHVPQLPFANKFHLSYIELLLENNQLTALPFLNQSDGYAMVSVIYAKNNSITKLTSQNIPKYLRKLDLQQNKLQSLSPSVLDKLNRTLTLQRLELSENPWNCNCATRTFWIYTQQHQNTTFDSDGIKCQDGRSLTTKEPHDLCPDDRTLSIVAAVVLILFSVSAGIFAAYYKYEQEVKVWIFAHNLLSWIVTEQDVDQHKKYDAFISYSSLDHKLVGKIVAELENGTTPFKLCLHDRNWLVGSAITQSIAESVENSRRTIIVLTRNFVESYWATMEFRVAHTKSLRENRARVIIIVCCDLNDIENMDDEFQAYLRTNTYIRLEDAWFWEKLRYAMPHPSVSKRMAAQPTVIVSLDIENDDLNVSLNGHIA